MMDEHKCMHEVDFALMSKSLEENTRDTKEILRMVKGNGGPGLLTNQALLKQSISRLWWWVGSISIAGLGLTIYCIKKVI